MAVAVAGVIFWSASDATINYWPKFHSYGRMKRGGERIQVSYFKERGEEEGEGYLSFLFYFYFSLLSLTNYVEKI